MAFHEGELKVQEQAGVTALAARLEGMLDPPDLDGGAHRLLAERELAVISARDAEGRLWVSPLVGPAGFLDAHATELVIGAAPAEGDPLHGLPPGQPLGLLAIDFATRRRMRVNGRLTVVGPDSLGVVVDEAYGNCPQFIQQRHLELVPAPPSDAPVGDLITSADTFFLGTTHSTRGNDASHRGGPPGFVRVDGQDLWWPDYAGNNMFNSFGNLAVDDTAALLFVDFATGQTVHLTGTARVEQVPVGSPGDDGGTGRRVRFTPSATVVGHALGARARDDLGYPLNPPLT